MKSVQKYNSLNGVVSCSEIKKIKDLAALENQLHIEKKLSNLLNENKGVKHFDIKVENTLEALNPEGLYGSWHEGIEKEALDECGRLKKGYYYAKGGVIKKSKTKVKKTTNKPNNALKNKVLALKDKYGLGSPESNPIITQGLNGTFLANGHEILSYSDIELFGEEEEVYGGLNAKAKDVEEAVNSLILNKINTGEELPPWRQSWAKNSNILAQNFETKKPYSGSNATILNVLLGSIMPTPYYLTFNQVKKLKGTVKKGAKSVPLVYYNFFYKLKDLSSNPTAENILLSKINGFKVTIRKKTITLNKNNYAGISLTDQQIKKLKLDRNEYIANGFLKYYSVFNVADTEGIDYELPKPNPKSTKQKIDSAEAIIKGFLDKPKIIEKGDDAVYIPKLDTIKIPVKSKFDPLEEYYTTLFHELIHSTLHETRLDREKLYEGKEENSRYAFEELIAELGASYLCGICGILDVVHLNSAAYLKGWHEKLQKYTKSNSNFFVFATKETQKAVDYILKGYEDPKDNPTPEKEDKEQIDRDRARALALKIKLANLKK